MQSTPNLREADPHDLFVIDPNVSLAARADKAPLDRLYDVLSHSAGPQPPAPASALVRPDPELRIAPDFSATAAAPPPETPAYARAVDDRIQLGETEISAHQPATGKFARRAVMGLFAVISAVGAATWQHYGDDAKAMVANWTPPLVASLAATANPVAAAPATTEPAPAAQTAAADQIAPPSSAAAQPAADVPAAATAPTAPAGPDAQQVEAMTRDIAAMGQQISELKASIEQLKASQAQIASASAKATEARLAEPAPRPRIAPPPPPVRAATATTRKPKQVFPYAPIAPAPPPQVAAVPAQMAPAQAAEAADGGPVVRPPMPLR